jgi:hypothetical protein
MAAADSFFGAENRPKRAFVFSAASGSAEYLKSRTPSRLIRAQFEPPMTRDLGG